jgi:S-adenosylmethionine:tRNA ribosyltransferase-isomerase
MIPQVQLEDYHYQLPQDRIATIPVEPRDSARLMVYKQGIVSHSHFRDLPSLLPSQSLLFFNNTRVIPARLLFTKPTGALIEVFLLEPTEPGPLVAVVMQQTETCTWHCLIGNKKRWKPGEVLTRQLPGGETLQASYADAEQNLVRFTWAPREMRWIDLIQSMGEIPLPPYLNRRASEADKLQYQTVYARKEGAVAAPTAGLHFTEQVFKGLREKGIATDFLTLHVGAGTFQPIKVDKVVHHPMHSEQMVFTLENLDKLSHHQGPVIAVGTTSMRALESLYWHGIECMQQGQVPFRVSKLYPYENHASLPPAREVFSYLAEGLRKQGQQELMGETEIFIFPGYPFKACEGLITNYHMPQTTLILLIAAFIGENWRKVYQEALDKAYRFLSYGDSSLLLP